MPAEAMRLMQICLEVCSCPIFWFLVQSARTQNSLAVLSGCDIFNLTQLHALRAKTFGAIWQDPHLLKSYQGDCMCRPLLKGLCH